jgi:hypothetical protein
VVSKICTGGDISFGRIAYVDPDWLLLGRVTLLQLRGNEAEHVLAAIKQSLAGVVVGAGLSLVEALEGILLVAAVVARVGLEEAGVEKANVGTQGDQGTRVPAGVQEGGREDEHEQKNDEHANHTDLDQWVSGNLNEIHEGHGGGLFEVAYRTLGARGRVLKGGKRERRKKKHQKLPHGGAGRYIMWEGITTTPTAPFLVIGRSGHLECKGRQDGASIKLLAQVTTGVLLSELLQCVRYDDPGARREPESKSEQQHMGVPFCLGLPRWAGAVAGRILSSIVISPKLAGRAESTLQAITQHLKSVGSEGRVKRNRAAKASKELQPIPWRNPGHAVRHWMKTV